MNDISPLISVIIPVFNNEKSIKDSIYSVINQSYCNLQIIVVNDGSMDNSLDVINKLLALDDRLVCINQQNRGTNLARKAGLDVAKGKYVQYLDGDDILLPDAIERLVECAETTSADIVSAPFIFRYEDGREVQSPILAMDEVGGVEYFRMIFDWVGATWNMWGNFQKRSLVYDYNIEILSDIPYGQDATWMIQLFFHNPKIVSLKTPILYYNQNQNSVSYSKTAADRRYRGARILYKWFEGFLIERGEENSFRRELAIIQLDMTFTCIHAQRFDNVCADMKCLLENVKQYPELIGRLSRLDRKILKRFQRFFLFGYASLNYYRVKGRL